MSKQNKSENLLEDPIVLVNVSDHLEVNLDYIKRQFLYPTNEDLNLRELFIPSLHRKGTIVYVNGTVDLKRIEEDILMSLQRSSDIVLDSDDFSFVIRNHVLNNKVIDILRLDLCIKALLNGSCVLFIEGYEGAFSFDTVKVEHRSIDKPQSELVLRGPNEGFVESLEVNKSLMRKHIKTQKLVSVRLEIGTTSKNAVSLLYIDGITNPDLIQEVKKRVEKTDVDSIMNISILEQYIEERSYSLIPSVLYTERPDRAASFLLEGHVIILGDSPACLVAPVTFWALFHTADDTNQRWFFGNFIRMIRMIAVFISTLIPSLYIAATNFHEEMIPTDLLLAIAAKRESVPFPAFIEVLIMEITFEILREAGLRVPTPMGATIGIVGALILGQAAVEANIISPIMVIVVALTGLASFAIPDISFNFMIRIVRFLFLFCTSIFGLLGMMSCLISIIAYLVSIRSFGVPFLSPLAPYMSSSKDLVFRPPVWKQWLRPQQVKPQDRVRKKRPLKGNS